ncbi:MAG: hypothetical protein EON56_02830 [Alphaproteobacteria bacterium]|nr:MAG: hypothetical protein EON56_02830 [Alphaproteobacteria bacterium]
MLIVLPKWTSSPNPHRSGWVNTMGTLPLDAALASLPEGLRVKTKLVERNGASRVSFRRWRGPVVGSSVEVDNLRTLEGAGWIPFVVDEQGRSVLAMDRETLIMILADPDLLNTQGLKRIEGARTAVGLVNMARSANTPVVFDLTLHGFQRTRNPLRLMLEPPLLGMTLVLVALAVFGGFQAAVRFGPSQGTARVIALGKRGLAENTAALVRLARREHHMATPYAVIVRNDFFALFCAVLITMVRTVFLRAMT